MGDRGYCQGAAQALAWGEAEWVWATWWDAELLFPARRFSVGMHSITQRG